MPHLPFPLIWSLETVEDNTLFKSLHNPISYTWDCNQKAEVCTVLPNNLFRQNNGEIQQ